MQKELFLVANLKITDDPNPLVRGTEPRIRIRTKMSRIHNTATGPQTNCTHDFAPLNPLSLSSF